MKTIFLSALILFAINNINSQSNNNKIISKQIVINIDDTSKVLKIKKIEDGNEEEITIIGDDVDKYLEEENISNGNIYKFKFNCKDDSLLAEKFKEFEFFNSNPLNDSNFIFNWGFDSLFTDSYKHFKKYKFNDDDIFQEFSFDFDSILENFGNLSEIINRNIEKQGIQNNDNNGFPSKKRIEKEIRRKIVQLEDIDENKNFFDVKIIPNLDSNYYNLEIVSNKTKPMIISLTDLSNNLVFTEIIKIKGTYVRTVKLDNSGTFILEIKQGKEKTTKKIIISN